MGCCNTTSGNSTVIGTNTGYSGINGIAISPEVVGINQIGQTIPSEYSLKQNYPNPFNPSTIIEFDMKTSGAATLKVFDALGREVRTIHEGFTGAGSYRYEFSGNGLPSGVYYYSLKAGDFFAVRKFVLIK